MVKRKPLTAAQKRFVAEMRAGFRLSCEGGRFYLNHRELTKKSVISMLKKRAIRPAGDGAFGRSQTYLVAE